MAVRSRVDDGLFTEDDCRSLAERVLGLSQADETSVELVQDRHTHLRFARNSPSTSGIAHRHTLTVRATFGTRSGSASGNQLDPASLESLVRRAEEVARRSPEDPEHVEGLGPQVYEEVPPSRPESEEECLERMASGVSICIDGAEAAGLVAAGFVEGGPEVRCLASSRGLFGHHRSSSYTFSETVRTPDGTGSGWASTAAARAGELDFAGVSGTAVEKARRSASPRPLPPDDYPAVLEPACVASLLRLLMRSMDARAAAEGRSYFSAESGGGATRLGETLFPDVIDVRSNPGDAAIPTVPWAPDGLPHRPTTWIRRGVLTELATSRHWAQVSGAPALPSPPNALMAGQEKSVEDLVRSTERGVLVTNFWYMRSVDPRTLLYTGLTRDGVFWIEDGEVRHPVQNFRWNESPVRALQNALELSRPRRVGGRGGRSRNTLVPGLRVSSFGFSSVSEAV